MHSSSESSSWLLRTSFTRLLIVAALVVVAFLVVIGGFVGWRWHKAHLPTPHVPSVWVNIGNADAGVATMFKWVVTGQQISGIYFHDDVTDPSCSVEPFVGNIDGRSISLTATFLNGSGTVKWSGTVSADQLVLDGEVYSPGSAASFAHTLTAQHYPSCGLGSS